LRPVMQQADRAIDWRRDDTQTVLRKIDAADGFPGLADSLFGQPCHIYDAWPEARLRGAPGVEVGPNRPDALVLAYPVISSGEFAHRGSFDNLLGPGAGAELLEEVSLERRVGPDAPPTFIWHTSDDASVPVENSLLVASALRARELPFELHVYRSGTHGLSLATEETEEPGKDRRSDPRVATWMELCTGWLKDLWT